MGKASEQIGTDWELLEEVLSLTQEAAFFFVLCDEGMFRERQMQRLREAVEAKGRSVQVVRFDPESPHLFSKLDSLPIDSSPVVFVDVRGIELARESYAEMVGPRQPALNARRALQSLNLQREQLAALKTPILFWVSAQAMGQIAQRAADLFATRSGIFDLRGFESFPRLEVRALKQKGLGGLEELRGFKSFPRLEVSAPERTVRSPALLRATLDLPADELRRRLQLYGRRLREEEAKPSPHLPRQAALHQELARIAWALRESTQALEHQAAAITLYRKLATNAREDFLAHLAASLHNLGAMLSDLGRREEALAATQEAAALYRRLAAQQPEAFLPNLAASLNNLGSMLSDLGRREEALAAAQEAVALYRQLAAQQPEAFLPNLAMSLNNLGSMLSALGQREEALAAAQEAAALYRQLAAQRPDAFLPNLARSLGTHGVVLNGLGRHAEAAAALAEGLRVILPFVRASPAAFGELANALLRNYLAACK